VVIILAHQRRTPRFFQKPEDAEKGPTRIKANPQHIDSGRGTFRIPNSVTTVAHKLAVRSQRGCQSSGRGQ